MEIQSETWFYFYFLRENFRVFPAIIFKRIFFWICLHWIGFYQNFQLTSFNSKILNKLQSLKISTKKIKSENYNGKSIQKIGKNKVKSERLNILKKNWIFHVKQNQISSNDFFKLRKFVFKLQWLFSYSPNNLNHFRLRQIFRKFQKWGIQINFSAQISLRLEIPAFLFNFPRLI
jgi:hypothetical protein